ncbi:hypothetical protein RFN28_27650 [Mesorhizobium sp. VK24D]|uniref:Uncharacterized protein n=1 Tax=Mesorhizobium album TaxID=3072314 RepID=A0ABU4Y5K0_9HYPH|nr:hypothetical protein [Mesorhizobium sp. VK24D]MDX8482203.1 hypothetical protein [Mesorhizobium sp. VK24D]
MLTKVLAASALVLGMAGSAMAQSSDDAWWWWWHSDRPVSRERVPVDPYTTGSIYSNGEAAGLDSLGNQGPVGPCASDTAGPNANAGLNVNDQYCGK